MRWHRVEGGRKGRDRPGRRPGDPARLLGRVSRGGRAEAARCPGLRPCRLDCAIARRSVGHKRGKQFICRFGHLVNGPAERRLVRLGGPGEAAQLADELQGRRPDLLRRGGRSEVMERLYVAAHENPRHPINTVSPQVADLPPIIKPRGTSSPGFRCAIPTDGSPLRQLKNLRNSLQISIIRP